MKHEPAEGVYIYICNKGGDGGTTHVNSSVHNMYVGQCKEVKEVRV